jgi:GTP-binding protein LepA
MDHIRNFCIIAHIDHGKSTLADRLLQMTGTIADRDMQAQALDDMDLERERGITIKSKAIQMDYSLDGKKYVLNLIDTPGHVDFSYEVSRSIAACEGALLIVDATQGIQAQTISNLYLALEHDLEIIPILNKMDLASANPEEVKDQIVDLLGCKREEIMAASGKTGLGVDKVLEEIVHRVPPPKGDPAAPLQALIFDSVFNSFRGIIAYFRVMNGTIRKGDQVKFFNTGVEYAADEVGILKMDISPRPEVKAGDVGYIISGIKTASEVKVGDTITHRDRPCSEAIHGFEDVKPMVWAGIFPVDTDDYEEMRDAMEKLKLNDASLTWTPESSAALGFGFRCGFLGLLHMEIIQERLQREFNMTRDHHRAQRGLCGNQDQRRCDRGAQPRRAARCDAHREDRGAVHQGAGDHQIAEYTGAIMTLCIEKRGILTGQNYLTTDRVELSFELPLGEVVFDFYDKLKSISAATPASTTTRSG